MKEVALMLWCTAIGIGMGVAFDMHCLKSDAEQHAIERANRAGRENLLLRAELDAVRREQVSPDRPPEGERIPAPNPPLPVTP